MRRAGSWTATLASSVLIPDNQDQIGDANQNKGLSYCLESVRLKIYIFFDLIEFTLA